MKKILLTIAAIALFAVPASSQVLSLWGDVEMTTCEFHTAVPYAGFDLFLILEPGADGAFAAEYMLTLPSNMLVQTTIESDVISVAMGNATGPDGISLGFLTCQSETFVVYQFLMVPLTTESGHFMIEPNADTGKLIIATCEEPLRPEKDCAVYNYFGFNDGCIVGTKESSWGAIKSMME